MAIETIKNKSGTVYRVAFRNPVTDKIEKSQRFETLKEAQRYDDEIKLRLKHEPETFAPVQEPKDDPQFLTLLLNYFQQASFTPSTKSSTFYHIKRIGEKLSGLPLSELERATIKKLESDWRMEGFKQNTIQRRVSIIKSALNWAVDEGRIKDNPLQGYVCKRGHDLKLVPPKPSEINAMLANSPPHLKRVIILSFELGMRVGPSELFKLRWDKVDFENELILIESADKNKDMPWREVNLRPSLLKKLAVWRQEDARLNTPWMINYEGKRVTTIKTAWRTALEKAGITRRIRPYDLRHAFATEALGAGGDLKAVSEIMGHASTTMIHKHYQHVLNRQRKAALNSLPELDSESEIQGTIQGTNEPKTGIFLLPEEKNIQ